MDSSPLDSKSIQPGHVLVVDDNERSRKLLKDVLTTAGYRISEADNGEDAISKAQRELPDVILLDVVLPQLGGFEVCRRLKHDPATASIHILMITCLTEREHRDKAVESGADDFLTKPIDPGTVLYRVQRAFNAIQGIANESEKATKKWNSTVMEAPSVRIPPIPPGRILVVDDDDKSRCLLRDLLAARGHHITEAVNGEEALDTVRREHPDVILLDVVMPGMSGFEVCRRLKADPATAMIHILLITSLTERKHRMKGIECGANDFLTKPVEPDEVLLRVRNAIMAKQVSDKLQLRHAEETLDGTLLSQLGNLSISNPGFAMGLLSIGAKLMAVRIATSPLDDPERERLYVVYEQLGTVLANSAPPQA